MSYDREYWDDEPVSAAEAAERLRTAFYSLLGARYRPSTMSIEHANFTQKDEEWLNQIGITTTTPPEPPTSPTNSASSGSSTNERPATNASAPGA